MFIDVHNHLDFYDDKIIKEIIERSKKAGVGIIVNNSVNPDNFHRVLELTKQYKEIKAALGIYPIDALKLTDKEIEKNIDFIRNNKGIVAIGEVGLDFKEDLENLAKQKQVFKLFIKLSIELDKPIIVHSRKAEKECIEILEEFKVKKVIMHCFSGKLSLVKRIIDNKWTLTIPTNVTFSEHFQKVIEMAPIEQLLCETDSPYLHPEKKRDNEPTFVLESYKKIASIKKITLREVEDKIEDNYKKLFR